MLLSIEGLIIRNFALARRFLEKLQIVLETTRALEELSDHRLYNKYSELDRFLDDLRRIDRKLKDWIDNYR